MTAKFMDHNKSSANHTQTLIHCANTHLQATLRFSVWGTYPVAAIVCTILHIIVAVQLLETQDSRSAALLSAKPPIHVPEEVETTTLDSIAVILVPQLCKQINGQHVNQNIQVCRNTTWIVHIEHQQFQIHKIRHSQHHAERSANDCSHKLLDDTKKVLLQCQYE